jgi:hypothetical protein
MPSHLHLVAVVFVLALKSQDFGGGRRAFCVAQCSGRPTNTRRPRSRVVDRAGLCNVLPVWGSGFDRPHRRRFTAAEVAVAPKKGQ